MTFGKIIVEMTLAFLLVRVD